MLRNTVRVLLSAVMILSLMVFPVQDKDYAKAGIKSNYTITEYNLRINPSLADQTVKIDADIALKANTDLTSVNLFYDPVFKIENIEGITGFKQTKDQLYIPVNVKAGKSFVLKLHYYALLKGIEYPGRQWNYVGPEGIYLYQWWYPVTQTTITQGFSEVVTMKIEMTILSDWSIASYDVIKKTPASDKKYTIHQLEIRDPAFYYHVVAGPYTTFEIQETGTKIKATYFGSKENVEIGKKIANEVFAELKYYESIFGTPAPQSYIIAQMPNQFKQATGEKGMLFIPGNMFAEIYKKEKEGGDKLKKDKEDIAIYDAEFLAERVAASWWGGTVYGIGPEADFLNISLSKYSSVMYMENRDGQEKLLSQLRKSRKLFFDKVKPEEEVPLTTFVKEDMLDVYYKGKGPLVFHMLRQVVGSNAFKAALKNYAGRFAGKFATLTDFDNEITKASGKKITWFFDQWVKQTGRLTYDIDFTLLPGEKPYRYKIRLENKGSIRMPFKIDVVFSDLSEDHFEWTTDTIEFEKIRTSDKLPVGAKINSPEGYMLNENSKINSLLSGPIKNFFYLNGNFMIIEGTLQGNERLEKAVKDRTMLYQGILKKEFKLDVKVVRDDEVTQDDLQNYNIILIGCTGCNRVASFFDGKTPISYCSYMIGSREPFIHGPEREGTYFSPNPSNPWRGLLVDEYFDSNDNYDPHKLPYDYYVRNLKNGEHAKGFFHKYNAKAWRAPNLPMISWEVPEKTNACEMFENVCNLKGSTNADLDLTYNPKNRIVFGKEPQKEFIQKGDFEKNISILRGNEFQADTIIVESQTEMATYKRILRYDFRGELEPPTMTFKSAPKSVSSKQDIVIDWEGRDNETYASDILYAWMVDGKNMTSFARVNRATIKGLKPGRHSIRFYCIDKRGNINYSIPTIVVDVTK